MANTTLYAHKFLPKYKLYASKHKIVKGTFESLKELHAKVDEKLSTLTPSELLELENKLIK